MKAAELALVESAAKADKGRSVQRNIGIAQAARLNRAGRPHVADEVVVLTPDGREDRPRIYVRGAVRHPDHKTVEFFWFRRTVPNRERFAQPAGVFWID